MLLAKKLDHMATRYDPFSCYCLELVCAVLYISHASPQRCKFYKTMPLDWTGLQSSGADPSQGCLCAAAHESANRCSHCNHWAFNRYEIACTLSEGQRSNPYHQHAVFAGAYMALKVTTQLQAVPSGSPEVAKVTANHAHICCLSPRVHWQVTCNPSAQVLLLHLQVLALFPFFQADLSNRQQKVMHALTKGPRVMGVVGAILGLLPMVCKRWLVNWWGGVLVFVTLAFAYLAPQQHQHGGPWRSNCICKSFCVSAAICHSLICTSNMKH